MSRHLPSTLMLLSLILLAGCERGNIHEVSIPAFGTDIEIRLYTDDPVLAREGIEALKADFQLLHAAWHAWKPGSLGRVNSLLPTGRPFSVGPSVLHLIEAAIPLTRQSEQLFNPAIGRLVALWGFHQDHMPSGMTPDPRDIDALLRAAPTLDDLVIDGVQLRSKNPELKLDFGGFAKGYGIEQAMAHLQALGIDNALIRAGNDLSVIGSQGARPWPAEITGPDGKILATLSLASDESLFTSHVPAQGPETIHSIIDPRTGRPARGSLSVSVLHSSAATADAAATALFIAGPDDWPRIARRMGITSVLLIDAQGQHYLSPDMARRIQFIRKPALEPLIIDPFAIPITGIHPTGGYNRATLIPAPERKDA